MFVSGMIGFGPRANIIPMKEVLATNHGNAVLRPMSQTLRPLPWATNEKYNVGEVLCETYWPSTFRSGSHQDACPRYVARKQVELLGELGYLLYSSFEAEFVVYKHESMNPIFQGHDAFSTRDLSEFESYVYELDHNLIQAGVDTGTLQTEYGHGQFEFAIKPSYGIDAADNMFRLKHGVKEMSLQQSMDAVFMTQPESGPSPNSISNGLHYNHSIWSKESNQNEFYDCADDAGLSVVARQWIAGLVNHAGGLTALCSPTVNCYRRLHNKPCPSKANWGIDDRFSAFRVKNTNAQETYVENRIPGGSANPYVVLAATVASGLSGINSKLEAPPQRQGNENLLPMSLSEALDCLEQDQVLIEALGQEFITWFVNIKREMEVDKLQETLTGVQIKEKEVHVTDIEKERNMYWKMF